MVMEASPSPQSVGREFVRQYYTLLNKAPAHLHRFYNNSSSFVHGGLDAPNRETPPVIGQKQIHNRIQQLNFRDCHAKISQVDSQATLGNGVVVQVTGELSNGGAPMRRFTQTFVLAAQSPKKYYVHNDIFRYQDMVFCEEECEGEPGVRTDLEDESYPAPPAPPATAPAPAAPPAAAHSPAPAPPAGAFPPAPPAPLLPPPPHVRAFDLACLSHHLNGHEERAAPLAPPPPAVREETGAEAEGEGEATEEGSAPPAELEPVLPPAPLEPKTYANLLKSGGHMGQATPATAPPPFHMQRVSGESLAARPPRSGPCPAPAAAPPARAPPRAHDLPPTAPPQAETGRRYSDSQQLFLGKVPHSATEEELRVLFSQFGMVADLRLHMKQGGRNQNYGFITYEEPQAAQDCLNSEVVYVSADGSETFKLNVEEKKTRGGRGAPPPRAAPSGAAPPSHRTAFPPRAPPAFRR